MRKVLEPTFFNRPSYVVAKDLLGKFLVRNIDDQEISAMIVEAEAYEGVDDLGSHASKGRTSRTEIMFDRAGKIYIYLIYGTYHMLNIVTGKKDYPAAVLIRGVVGVTGPGRLTRKLEICKKLNTLPLGKEIGLWVEDRGVKVSKEDIEITPRIGIDYAGPVWSQKPWRFVLSH